MVENVVVKRDKEVVVMLSWQIKLLEIYFRLQHAFAVKFGKVDVH